MVSFAVQKLVSLIRSNLFLLLFIVPRETDLRKIAMIYVSNVLPVFSSKSFVVPCLSCLMFKSLSHFELSFVYGVYGVRECSDFTDLHVALSSFLNTTCCGGWRFSIVYLCPLS